MIEILMADDHAIFRSGVRRLLSDEPDMRIVAEAANGQEALDFLRQHVDRDGLVFDRFGDRFQLGKRLFIGQFFHRRVLSFQCVW